MLEKKKQFWSSSAWWFPIYPALIFTLPILLFIHLSSSMQHQTSFNRSICLPMLLWLVLFALLCSYSSALTSNGLTLDRCYAGIQGCKEPRVCINFSPSPQPCTVMSNSCSCVSLTGGLCNRTADCPSGEFCAGIKTQPSGTPICLSCDIAIDNQAFVAKGGYGKCRRVRKRPPNSRGLTLEECFEDWHCKGERKCLRFVGKPDPCNGSPTCLCVPPKFKKCEASGGCPWGEVCAFSKRSFSQRACVTERLIGANGWVVFDRVRGKRSVLASTTPTPTPLKLQAWR